MVHTLRAWVQGHVRRSIYWAYLHWLCGRVTIAFAWVNMFLGVGRYRTWFNLGSWPEGALGLYFGAIILVSTVLLSWSVMDILYNSTASMYCAPSESIWRAEGMDWAANDPIELPVLHAQLAESCAASVIMQNLWLCIWLCPCVPSLLLCLSQAPA